MMVKTVDRRMNRILWQVPYQALLVEVPVLKVSATCLYQHLVGFHCLVCWKHQPHLTYLCKRKIARNLLTTSGKEKNEEYKYTEQSKDYKAPKKGFQRVFYCGIWKVVLPRISWRAASQKNSIEYHIKSGKHDECNTTRKRKINDQDIAQSLKKYNEEVYRRGETLLEQQQVFCVKVIKHFIVD